MSQAEMAPRPLRVREKLAFLDADRPGQALMDFFESLGLAPREEPDVKQDHVVRRPLIMISQLPRSGGSLLSQLLDGHPQLLVYPWEMKIGYPSKGKWPTLDLCKTPAHLFATLFHSELALFSKKGYRKQGKVRPKPKRLKFDYSPYEHYQNFVRLLPNECNRRDVLDTYFSTLFQAWRRQPEAARYVAGFVPRMAAYSESISGFFADYPDGRLISLIRDPADWFASHRAHTDQGEVRYGDVEEEMRTWNRMARLALEYQRKYQDGFLLLSFTDLVRDRLRTMTRVSDWLGIDFHQSLLEQTFDGNPISPNTNFHDPVERLAEAVLDRRLKLTESERRRAYELTDDLRRELKAVGLND